MKILIAYCSKTGHTEKLAEAIKKEHSFWGWQFIRLFKECEILPPKIKDLSKYDAICIGSPSWTRLSLPMARYFKKVRARTKELEEWVQTLRKK
jgi:flavodoxin